MLEDQSRRDRRKEARKEKNARKCQSWLQCKKSQTTTKLGKLDLDNKRKQKSSVQGLNFGKDSPLIIGQHANTATKSKSLVADESWSEKLLKRRKDLGKKSKKSKFEEYLRMEPQNSLLTSEEDLELERKLAKRLKVKDGKLRGDDDGVNILFEGIPSILDFPEEELPAEDDFPFESSENGYLDRKHKKPKLLEQVTERNNAELEPLELDQDRALEEEYALSSSKKKLRKKKSSKAKGHDAVVVAADSTIKTVESSHSLKKAKDAIAIVPGLEESKKYVIPSRRSHGVESEDYTQVDRLVRRLLNKLNESNVESITGEMSAIFHTVSGSVACQIINKQILELCSCRHFEKEQFAAAFSAFVAGMTCLVGIDFSAKLIASLAKTFEDEYLREDSLYLRSVTLLLSYFCIFGVFSSDLIYDFMMGLSKRLTETDVFIVLTVLQCCGLKLRGDDPAAMKNFILSIQSRVNELKASSGDGQTTRSKRMDFMLETIGDIKNNKIRQKEDPPYCIRMKKWLQKLRVEDVLIRGLTWSKLLDPDKKGQWWLSGDMASTSNIIEEVASTIDKEVLETQKMLQLAAVQRMNTDARRAIFCIIMSGEDYIDAFEKLLRLDLRGRQDREIMRVLVECCLQEKVFNKYYTILAGKLCEHERNHKFTLQFCLWDHFKELESMQLTRSMNLAKFVAEMISSFTLSLALLKTVELNDPKALTPKRIMHFRMLFEAVLERPEKLVWNVFTRVAVAPELEELRSGMEFFIREHVVKPNNALSEKFRIAKKALSNVEGVLM